MTPVTRRHIRVFRVGTGAGCGPKADQRPPSSSSASWTGSALPVGSASPAGSASAGGGSPVVGSSVVGSSVVGFSVGVVSGSAHIVSAQPSPQVGDVVALALRAARRLHNDRSAGGSDHRDDQFGVDCAVSDVLVSVPPGVERVPRVVGVNQVDPAGDRLDPVDDAEQVLATGIRMAGVQAETDVELADHIPQPGERVEAAGAGVVATV